MIPMPTTTTKLPRGHYVVSDDLCTALSKIPGVAIPEFPTGIESWVVLPHGTTLVTYEDTLHERLCCKHVREDSSGLEMSTIAFDRDQALLDRYLDS